MKHFQTAWPLIMVAIPLALAACSSNDSTPASTADDPTINKIAWESCIQNPSIECGTLEVPIDYNEPDGEKISLAVNRRPASGTIRRGSLLMNPGGPGGSGVDLIFQIIDADSIPEIILDEYDIVGFDPRGIGESRPIDCSEFGIDELDDYPVALSDIEQLLTDLQVFATACHEKYGDYLLSVGSNNVVRDMEEIRRSLGDEKLNFLGYSYGTRLAALYLQAYPTTSGKMILDASVPPQPSLTMLGEESLVQLQTNLDALLSQCSDFDPSCDPAALLQALQTRMDLLIQNEQDEELDLLGTIVFLSVEEPDLSEFTLPALVNYLANDDTTALLEIDRQLDELEGESEDEDNSTSLYAVICADETQRPDIGSLVALQASFNAASDIFAETFIAQAATCAGWPAAIDPILEISTNQAPDSIVIGGTTDANTPISWSEQMSNALGGTYIRSTHAGHTVVFQDASRCIDDQVVRFIREGYKPEITDCAADDPAQTARVIDPISAQSPAFALD